MVSRRFSDLTTVALLLALLVPAAAFAHGSDAGDRQPPIYSDDDEWSGPDDQFPMESPNARDRFDPRDDMDEVFDRGDPYEGMPPDCDNDSDFRDYINPS